MDASSHPRPDCSSATTRRRPGLRIISHVACMPRHEQERLGSCVRRFVQRDTPAESPTCAAASDKNHLREGRLRAGTGATCFQRRMTSFIMRCQWSWITARCITSCMANGGIMRSHLDGILPWTKLRLSNGAVEGMNNKIKSISNRSFGFRYAQYFICGCLSLPFQIIATSGMLITLLGEKPFLAMRIMRGESPKR
jgi:hypothetical protein